MICKFDCITQKWHDHMSDFFKRL